MRKRKARVRSREYDGTSKSALVTVKQGGTADIEMFVLDRIGIFLSSAFCFFDKKEETLWLFYLRDGDFTVWHDK